MNWSRAHNRTRWLLIGLMILYLLVVVRTAWLSDDAYITFRTVDNALNGYGLTWNVDERVQTYTHPLWLLILIAGYAITHEIYLTSLLLSIVIAGLAVCILVFRVARTPIQAALGLTVLIFSKAFIDFSTSGLENPLTYLIIALFMWAYTQRQPRVKQLFGLSLIAALGVLNRMDTALLFLPALFQMMLEVRRVKGLLAVGAGFWPVIAWVVFAVFYYGFPVPNTAYAKLPADLDRAVYLMHGLGYVLNSLRFDPLTLTAIAGSGLALIATRQWRSLPIVLGVLLYGFYVVNIGGDFMSGRFFAAPLFMMVSLGAQLPLPDNLRWQWAVPFALTLAIGLSAPHMPLFSNGDFGTSNDPEFEAEYIDAYRIGDERAYYYQGTGLLRTSSPLQPPDQYPFAVNGQKLRQDQRTFATRSAVGIIGYYAGPRVHILDLLALADPLLARLRLQPGRTDWRVGEFWRMIPCGYTETLKSGQNQIHDPGIAAYYDKLRLVVSGDLLDPQRLAEIWNMNTGKYAALLSNYKGDPKCP